MADLTVLIVGDITGKPGMRAVRTALPGLIAKHEVDFVIANGENAAGGFGITPDLAKTLLGWEIDCITSGNHIWRQREITGYIDDEPRLLRPLNLPASQPGRGYGLYQTAAGIRIGVINLLGQVYMDPANNPFTAADQALNHLSEAQFVFVDFHAEATSEKRAMGFHLDGRVTAVVGTHTHVQTADEQVLPEGTGFLTDIGMTGPHDSVIGVRKELIVDKFVNGMPHPFRLANLGVRFQAVLIRVDLETGRAHSLERINLPV